MSRFNSYGYGHFCKRREYSGIVWYDIGWSWDKYYTNSKLRYPQQIIRQTDEKGAKKFCKKWDIPLPKELSE